MDTLARNATDWRNPAGTVATGTLRSDVTVIRDARSSVRWRLQIGKVSSIEAKLQPDKEVEFVDRFHYFKKFNLIELFGTLPFGTAESKEL